jgi:hypothetical protein
MSTTTIAGDVQIIPMTVSTAEVRLQAGANAVSIGRIGSASGRWYWQHRDGEQSSPVAETRSAAAAALAEYHRAFKQQTTATAPAPGPAPVRRLLFG